MKRDGFLLIEFLVFCALVSVIIMLSGTFMHRFVTLTHQWSDRAQVATHGHVLADVLIRDCARARADHDRWYVSDTEFVCSWSKETAVGWHCDDSKKRLVRIQGTFDWQQHAWGKQARSLLSEGVTGMRCMIERNKEGVCSIALDIDTIHEKNRRIAAAVRNGITL